MKQTGELGELLGGFAALGDVLRLRMLTLLQREELTVGELAKVLQLPQSTVSRHLKVLSDGGWVSRRAAGTAGFYHMLIEDLGDEARALWEIVRGSADQLPQYERDLARLAQVLSNRSIDTHSFFGRVGGEWDTMRERMFGSLFTWQALLGLLPPRWTIADVGCGTGNASELLAPFVQRIVALDISQSMLDAARKRLSDFDNVDFQLAEIESLPLADDAVDAAVCVLVLHHIDDPVGPMSEMRRIVRPGGPTLIVDMMTHEHETYRHSMGHRHLGFAAEEMREFAQAAGFRDSHWMPLPPDPDAHGPQLFAASLVDGRPA